MFLTTVSYIETTYIYRSRLNYPLRYPKRGACASRMNIRWPDSHGYGLNTQLEQEASGCFYAEPRAVLDGLPILEVQCSLLALLVIQSGRMIMICDDDMMIYDMI